MLPGRLEQVKFEGRGFIRVVVSSLVRLDCFEAVVDGVGEVEVEIEVGLRVSHL